MLQPPNPVDGATAERSPVVADEAAGVISRTDRPAGSLAVTGEGFEDPPVGGSLADRVAAIQAHTPPSPEKPLSRPFWAFGGRLAESKAAGSPVTHELDPQRGRSTPGFGLPARELDVLAADDRATGNGVEACIATA